MPVAAMTRATRTVAPRPARGEVVPAALETPEPVPAAALRESLASAATAGLTAVAATAGPTAAAAAAAPVPLPALAAAAETRDAGVALAAVDRAAHRAAPRGGAERPEAAAPAAPP